RSPGYHARRGAARGPDPGRRGARAPDPAGTGLRRIFRVTVAGGQRNIGAGHMAEKDGWRGGFFEDFGVGEVYRQSLRRSVTQTDNIWFTLLTQNTAPIHFDAHYAAQTEFRKPLVDSTFTVALVTGQSVTDISQNVFANLGWDEIRLPNPVFEGDTIYSQ